MNPNDPRQLCTQAQIEIATHNRVSAVRALRRATRLLLAEMSDEERLEARPSHVQAAFGENEALDTVPDGEDGE
jgi:hypothetical protein